MNEARGDLFTYGPADARAITTNGDVAGEGEKRHAVMGRGVALQAAERWPDLPHHFAELLDQYQNRPMKLRKLEDGSWLVSMPVKHHWRDRADPDLVLNSALKLRDMADKFGWNHVLIPRAGAGSGGLDWASEVCPMLALVLDDRFTVVIPNG